MKKNVLAAIIAAAAMAAAFVGCNPDTDKPTPTEAATTENAEATTTETTEPVTTETAENTAEAANPTEETKYAVLDFNECAEEVLRLKPYKAEWGQLPEDFAGDTVLYVQADGTWFGPAWFATDGETIAVNDIADRLIIYNNGELNHFDKMCLSYDDYACMSGDYVYSSLEKINILTGEIEAKLSKPEDVSFVGAYGFTTEKNGTPKAICFNHNERLSDEEFKWAYYYNFMELDSDNTWKDKGEAFNSKELFANDDARVSLSNGAEWIAKGHSPECIGIDANNCYYFLYFNEEQFGITKVDSDGNFISQVAIPDEIAENLWDPHYRYNLLPDDTVYVAAAMNDAYVIWKINM